MKAIVITDKDLKDWRFGRRLGSLKRHFEDYGSTLKQITIECDGTIWVYNPNKEQTKDAEADD